MVLCANLVVLYVHQFYWKYLLLCVEITLGYLDIRFNHRSAHFTTNQSFAFY